MDLAGCLMLTDDNWLFLLKQTVALPIRGEGKTSHPPLLKPLTLLHFRWKKQSVCFGVEEMNVTIGIGGGNFLTDNLFQCIPSCSFSTQPMMMFDSLQRPTYPNRLWTAHPKGKSTQVLHLIGGPAELCCSPMPWNPLTDMAWGQATAWMAVILQALPCVAIFMPPSSLWETLGDSHKFVIHHRLHSRLNAIFPQRGFIKRKFMP